MRVPETAPLTSALFARKGEATAEGFVQPPVPPRSWFTPRVRRTVLVLALPVAYVGAAALAVLSLELGRDNPASVASERIEGAVVTLSLPVPLSPVAAARRPQTAVTRPLQPFPAPPERDAGAEAPPLEPVPVTFGVPPAPPLKPASVAIAGSPGKKLGSGSVTRAAGGRYRVQLASLESAEAVRREWERLKAAHGTVFRGLRLMMEKSPSGAFYHLQAGPVASRSAARKLCARLRRSNAGCLVVAR